MGRDTGWSRGVEALSESNIALPDGLYVLPRIGDVTRRRTNARRLRWWLRLLEFLRTRRIGVVRP